MSKPTFDQLSKFHRLVEAGEVGEEEFAEFLRTKGRPPMRLQVASQETDVVEVDYDLGMKNLTKKILDSWDTWRRETGLTIVFSDTPFDLWLKSTVNRSGRWRITLRLCEYDRHAQEVKQVPDVPGFTHADIFIFLAYVLRYPLKAVRNKIRCFGSSVAGQVTVMAGGHRVPMPYYPFIRFCLDEFRRECRDAFCLDLSGTLFRGVDERILVCEREEKIDDVG